MEKAGGRGEGMRAGGGEREGGRRLLSRREGEAHLSSRFLPSPAGGSLCLVAPHVSEGSPLRPIAGGSLCFAAPPVSEGEGGRAGRLAAEGRWLLVASGRRRRLLVASGGFWLPQAMEARRKRRLW